MMRSCVRTLHHNTINTRTLRTLIPRINMVASLSMRNANGAPIYGVHHRTIHISSISTSSLSSLSSTSLPSLLSLHSTIDENVEMVLRGAEHSTTANHSSRHFAQLPFVYGRAFSTSSPPPPSSSSPPPPNGTNNDRDDSKQNSNDNKSGSSVADDRSAANRRTAKYIIMIVIGMIGAAYLVVPLYRLFCQITGYAGTTKRTTRTAGHGKALDAGIAIEDKLEQLVSFQDKFALDSDKRRELTIIFTSDVDPSCPWQFYPSQHKMKLRVGDNALAFYTAKNMADKTTCGVATYNVTPMKAGQYFNKVQCFCFDEQRLRGGQEVQMPVWFFVDPKFSEDPMMNNVDELTLSYTFYSADADITPPDLDDDDDDDDEPIAPKLHGHAPTSATSTTVDTPVVATVATAATPSTS